MQRGRRPAKLTQICYSNQYPKENMNLAHHLKIFLWTLTSDGIQVGEGDRKTGCFQNNSCCSTEVPGLLQRLEISASPSRHPRSVRKAQSS